MVADILIIECKDDINFNCILYRSWSKVGEGGGVSALELSDEKKLSITQGKMIH